MTEKPHLFAFCYTQVSENHVKHTHTSLYSTILCLHTQHSVLHWTQLKRSLASLKSISIIQRSALAATARSKSSVSKFLRQNELRETATALRAPSVIYGSSESTFVTCQFVDKFHFRKHYNFCKQWIYN